MNHSAVLFFLGLIIVFLLGVILYQQMAFRTGVQKSLKSIHIKLAEILDTDSDERIMVFTENRALMELAAQINRMLEEQHKQKVNYRRFEAASRKMLSNISHDMKTPLTVILGYLEIMRINDEVSPKMQEKTEQKARELMELVNQFFTLAKLEAGDMDLKLSRLDICEICRESILEFYELLSKEAFQVEIELPEEAVYIQGNQEALQRILRNLISNVIRYGRDGNYIGIFLKAEENQVYLDVADKGAGIDRASARHVFDRLFTMEDSRNRNIQGNGLGLTIARNLAEQLGGELTLESIPHIRTTFTVKLKRMKCKKASTPQSCYSAD